MVRIYPSQFAGTLKAPASKAHAQRLLLMSSMPAYATTVKNVPDCVDIDVTIDCLKALGCAVERKGSDVTVHPFPKTTPLPDVEFNFRESATTAKMVIALCSALGIKASCKAMGTLPKRKFLSLTSRMAIRGLKFSSFSIPFDMSGRLESGHYEFNGDEGSQNISALLCALPLLLGDSTVKIQEPVIDKSFIDITIDSLRAFGIEITETSTNEYFIKGKQFYQSPKTITVENDWSLATMWATAAAACGVKAPGLTVTGLNQDSHQKYRTIDSVSSLIRFDFQDINIDVTEFPNLAPLYGALAIVKGATVRVYGAPLLKYKETNRLQAMVNIAKALGQDGIANDDGFTIIGNGHPSYKEDTIVNCEGDPWVYMSMALSAATMHTPLVLDNEHCGEKIYADFLNDFAKVGGKALILKK